MDKRPHYVKWYKTSKWIRLRAWQLKHNPLCKFCKNEGRITAANTVDHIKPHKGDINLFFMRSNLQSLCKPCHSSAKQRMEKSGEFGCDENGLINSWR